jgi:hypothetical protein
MTLQPPGEPARGRAPVPAGWQARRRRDLTAPLTIITGLLVALTTSLLAVYLYVSYQPGSGVAIPRFVHWLTVIGLVGAGLIAVGGVIGVVQRSRRRP